MGIDSTAANPQFGHVRTDSRISGDAMKASRNQVFECVGGERDFRTAL